MDSSVLDTQWAAVCDRIKSYPEVDFSQINAFFSRIQPQAMSEGFLMLTADNEFIKNWVSQHFLSIISRALQEMFGVPFSIIIEVDTTSSQSTPLSDSGDKTATPPLSSTHNDVETQNNVPSISHTPFIPASFTVVEDTFTEPYQREILDDNPTSTLTFENFVIGDSNRMAYSMAVDVAEMPGKTPLNPLFIYGKSGLGKTHLMRAIQNYVCETQPQLRVVYVDSAELLSNYMDAAAANDKEKTSYKNFKTYYEEADVLLIDDIQYLQGKKQTLDIVFQIFNKLMDQGRQIVFSADRAPKNIDVDERYHSRFNRGGTIDIQPPEIETKLSIVKSLLNQYKNSEGLSSITIPEDVQLYIAENSSSNIRELKSAITKVIYQIKFFDNKTISIENVHSLLKDHFSGGNSKNLTVEDIQGVVENFFKVSHKDLVGPKRERKIVYPRQIAIYLCRQLLDVTFNDIAKKFNRDHSTAMHSVTSIEELVRNNREVQEEIEIIKQSIKEL